MGLKLGDSDPNLFISRGVYLLLFVNNMLIIKDCKLVNNIKREINKLWKCEDFKATSTFVGF